MSVLDAIAQSVVEMDKEHIAAHISKALKDESLTIQQIYEEGLNKGMTRALDLYEAKQYYLPEIIVCADTLNIGLDLLKSQGTVTSVDAIRVVIAVIEGDTHEIGKNIVKVMMDAAGFNVYDLGVNQRPLDIVETALTFDADVIALSSMMTSTMTNMRFVIEELNQRTLEKRPFVVIGGAPVTESFAMEIGADGYADNAPDTVVLMRKLCKGSHHG